MYFAGRIDTGVTVIHYGYFPEYAGKNTATGLLRLYLVFTFFHEAYFEIMINYRLEILSSSLLPFHHLPPFHSSRQHEFCA